MRLKSILALGVLAGLLTTLPLTALLYLAEQAAGLPFVPFDVFDWLARVLPGDVITKGIDAMVTLIRRLDLGETSSTAKRLETLLALAQFVGGGVGAGVVLFAILYRLGDRARRLPVYLPGALLGAAAAVPLILISQHIGAYTDAPPEINALWLLLACVGWGAALEWTCRGLLGLLPDDLPTSAPTVKSQSVTTQLLNRREFLIRVGGATATLTVIGAGLGRYLEYRAEQDYQALIRRRRAAVLPQGLPNQGTGLQPAPGTRPEYTPLEDHYRIDISVRPKEIDGQTYRLRIGGLVDRPLELSLDDLRSDYAPLDQYVTLACISNPVGGDLTSTTRWTGASLQEVLAGAGIQENATHLLIRSADDFFETVALDLVNGDPRIMLTYDWDGIPLLYEHGFPLRIYIPDRYGMKQPKWITEIEVIDHDLDGYWVERGWDKVAQMRATAVVDVVASDMTVEQGGQTLVPVGGIAHAGARGISKVEVRVDDGEWVEAQLRPPLSETTWVIWRYDWPFQEGRHTFTVRCAEGDGTPQIEERSPTKPSGATGLDQLTREI